jgi:hypothetical protein
MNKRIDDAYSEHMQKSSPDMDMLWARIERRIDASQKSSEAQTAPQITQSAPAPKSKGIAKYIALAACLAAVVAGTVVFMTSKENEVKSDTTISAKGDASYSTADKTYNDNVAGDNYGKKGEENNANVSSSKEKMNIRQPETKTSGSALDPEKSMRELKQTDEYIAADFEHRIEMLTGLAEKMKSQSVITQYQVKRKNTNSRLEMTLPDGTLIMILL